MTTRRGFLVGSGAAAIGTTLGGTPIVAAVIGMDRNRVRGADIVAEKPGLRDPWSMARSAGILGTGTPGPIWPKAEMLSFTAEIDGATASVWLPPPLVPTDPARAMVFVARYPMTKLGFGYNEAAVFLHGSYEGKTYMHCTWMVVDDDTALILGRDMLGFPKKMAVIEADIHGTTQRGRVERKGLPVLEVSASSVRAIDLSMASADLEMAQLPIVNVVGDPRGGATLLQTNGGQTVHQASTAEFEVSFSASDLDPLYRLGMETRQTGTVVVVDMGLGGTQDSKESEATLTGMPVPANWMVQAYPFRVW